MSAIQQLLTDPRPESPLNVDVAVLMKNGDTVGWEGLVRYWAGEERWEGNGGNGSKESLGKGER